MPRIDLELGGYVRVYPGENGPAIEVGYEGEGMAAVETSGLDEFDRVLHLLAHNELPDEDDPVAAPENLDGTG